MDEKEPKTMIFFIYWMFVHVNLGNGLTDLNTVFSNVLRFAPLNI